MEYIAGKGGAPYVLPLLATYADEQTVYVIPTVLPERGFVRGCGEGWWVAGSYGRDLHGANCQRPGAST